MNRSIRARSRISSTIFLVGAWQRGRSHRPGASGRPRSRRVAVRCRPPGAYLLGRRKSAATGVARREFSYGLWWQIVEPCYAERSSEREETMSKPSHRASREQRKAKRKRVAQSHPVFTGGSGYHLSRPISANRGVFWRRCRASSLDHRGSRLPGEPSGCRGHP